MLFLGRYLVPRPSKTKLSSRKESENGYNALGSDPLPEKS